MTTIFFINLLYLSGAVCFVLGLRFMGAPGTARKGNTLAATGVALAVLAVVTEPMPGPFNNYAWIAGALLSGAAGGYYMAVKALPASVTHLVPVFNGLGGACAAILGLTKIMLVYNGESAASPGMLFVLLLAILIGGVVFTGSFLAYAKMEGLIKDRSMTLKRHDLINVLLLTITVFCGIFVYLQGDQGSSPWAAVFMLVAFAFGISLVAPIKAVDAVLATSLLNAFSGLATATAGLICGSHFLLVAGVLIGATGATLTFLMCRTMNRSLITVFTGGIDSRVVEDPVYPTDVPDAVKETDENKIPDSPDS